MPILIDIHNFILALKGENKDFILNDKEVIINDRILKFYGKKDTLITTETFKFPIQIDHLEVQKNQNLIFSKCTFNCIELKGLIDVDNFKFHNCKFNKIILNGQIGKLEIRGCQIDNFHLSAGTIQKLVISGEKPHEDLKIQEANIDLRYAKYFYLLSADIIKLSISRIQSSLNPFHTTYHELNNIKVDNLHFSNINSGKNLFIRRIYPVSKASEFYILNTDLREVIFRDCDFRPFKYLKIKNSHLEDIKSENMHWFRKVVNWNEEEDIISYRQLKAAMMNQHDKVSEIYFRSKEMDAYLKWLKFRENKSEWLLLQANKCSNQHGQSWIKGIKFTLVTSLLFYIIYLFSLKKYPYEFGWQNLDSLFNAISYFIGNYSKFFIITHNFDFMPNSLPRGISYLIDTLSRIVISYGIYQTVQAFRKYGR